jgi:peptidoglycan/LPS O-acetylase OafA/YrhL
VRDGVEGAVIVRDARFPLVDATRAIAALSIVAYHVAFVQGWFDADGVGRWLARLNVGVPLFFAISGFLLYRPWAAARLAGQPPPSTRVYALRRALRVLPAYWVALTVIALVLDRRDVFSWPGAAEHYGLLQAYDPDRFTGGIGQAWTLTVEVAFYAVLPLLALGMRRVSGDGLRGELALLVGLAVGSLAWKAGVLLVVDEDAPAYLPLLTALPAQLDMFAAGMALAVLSAAGRGARLGRAPWLVWLAAAVAFAALGAWRPAADAPRVLGEHALQLVVAAALLVPAVVAASEGGAIRRALAWRPLAWIGLVSSGVYLWHLDAIRELADTGAPGAVVVVVGPAIAIALGAASWYVLERYALRLGRRAADRGTPRDPRPAEPVPVTPRTRST